MHRARLLPITIAVLAACARSRAPAPSATALDAPPATAIAAGSVDAGAAPAAVRATPITGGAITIEVLPAPAYIERGASAQLVNCDLLLDNGTGVPWRLLAIELSVHDRSGALAWRKRVDDNGVSPAITTIPNRELPATGKVLLLNPLNELPLAVDPTRLRFELTFTRTDGDERTSISVDLAPAQYDNHAALQLPVGA